MLYNEKRNNILFHCHVAFPDSSRASMDDCFCKLAPSGAQTVQRSHHWRSQNLRKFTMSVHQDVVSFFLCIANINFEWCSLFCQVDIRLFLRSVVPYHLYDATTPRGWTAAFGCWPARPSRSWGKGAGRENTLRV